MLARLAPIAVLLAAVTALAPQGARAQDKSILVFAAASMKNALDDVDDAFTRATQIKVTASYDASSALMKQIEGGAPADVFVSADLDWMDYGSKHDLIKNDTRVNLLGNKLVLITAKTAPTGNVAIGPGFDPAGLAANGKIATGDVRAVPVGLYAKAALEKLGLWATVEPKIAMTQNVRVALTLVARGEAALGIVYATDAKVEPNVKVIGTFPDNSHPPIIYPVAATTTAKPEAAQYRLPAQQPSQDEVRGLRVQLPGAADIVTRLRRSALQRRRRHDENDGRGSCSISPPMNGSRSGCRCEIAIVATAVALPFGIAVAWLLARKSFWGKTLLDGIVHLPLVLPPVVTGYLLLISFGRRGAIGAFLADYLGIVFSFRWTGAALACGIMGFPLMVRPIRLAIEAIDRRLEDAAATLGADRLRVFSTVTLPLALPGLIAGIVLCFAKALGEFGATITFVANIPGETQTISAAI